MLFSGEVHGVGQVVGDVKLHIREGCHSQSSSS